MPIHFTCHSCLRRLSVGSHKAGTDAQCPKCQAIIHIPTREQAQTFAAMTAALASGSTARSARDVFDFDFEDLAANTPVASSAPVASDSPGTLDTSPSPRITTAEEDFDADLVSISRRALYAQGFLIAAVGLLAFVGGFLVGSGGPPSSDNEADAVEQPAAGPIRLAGRLTFEPTKGNIVGDVGAVIIVLSRESLPDDKLQIAGLRPHDAELPADAPALRAIQSLGGAYRRADATGTFEMELTRPGKYHVLRLSHSAQRSVAILHKPEVLSALSKFFDDPSELLGRTKYQWETIDISPLTPIDHHFGVSGE